MTSPGASAPDGAWVWGGRYGQDVTDSSARAVMSSGVVASYQTAQDAHTTNVKAPLQGQASSIANHETRIVTLENGGIMTVYSGNATWINPGKGIIGVGVINGGQAGQDGAGGYSGLRLGGNHGGYQYQEFDCRNLPATVDLTIGAPGATAAQGGGITSFGTFLLGLTGVAGTIRTATGAIASTSAPGAGGNTGASIGTPGVAGDSSALANGGSGGASNPSTDGGAGGSVDPSSTTPGGGGGGGGGGSTTGSLSAAGNGGNGGAPGGGGGAGGIPGAGGAGGFHGSGAAGRAFIIQF